MPNDCTISSAVPLMIALTASQVGVDPALVLRESGLDLTAPPPPDEHVEVGRYLDVFRRAMALVRDAAFPIRAATTFQLEDHEVFGFLAMSCATLGEAYEKTALYRALYCVGARWELVVDKQATRLVWYPWPGDVNDAGHRAAMDYAVADMAKAIRRLGQTGPRPVAVHMVHPAPTDRTPFTAFYGVTPVYDAPLYELVYAPGLVDTKVATFNSRLRDYFASACSELAEKRASGSSATELVRRALIGKMDGGDVSMEGIAKALGLSARSLQRRLSEEGTRFNDVLAEIRAEFAKRYLARKSVSASEVAYLIGFTEPPAFFKAFKRWTGMTPREYQQRAVA